MAPRLPVSRIADVPRRIADGLHRGNVALARTIEERITAHHRRRLRRHGWEDVLSPAGTQPSWVDRVPVREGNTVEVLVDGEETFARIQEAIEGASRSVHIAGWFTAATFALVRDADGSGQTLQELLARTAQRIPVRVLVWAGPPMPAFQPTRRQVKENQRLFSDGSAVEYRLDHFERLMHCHHEKLVIVDDEEAFVGGLDFAAIDGDRHDTSEHAKTDEVGWHDVAALVRGPVVADVAAHFALRWQAVTQEALPAADPQTPRGAVPVQFLRTVPNGVYDVLPDGDFSILAAYLQAVRAAREFIYLENQFLWSPEVIDLLIDKLAHPPSETFRVLLVLPRRPDNGNDTTNGQLARLIAADQEGGGGRLLATTLLGPTYDSPGVYVHAKVGIIDDAWLTIGSANLNEHSLYNDSECNVLTLDADLARRTRLRLWAEHLRLSEDDIGGPVADVIDRIWVAQCDAQDEVSEQERDPVHRVRRLAGLSRRRDRLKGPLLGLVVDG